jgi:thioredoxin 1
VLAVLDITTENFETEVAQAELPVLMDFWAHWCGPCKLVLPSVEWAAKEYDGQIKVVKVEADSNKDLVEKFKVYGLPTIILVKDGKKMSGSHHEGAITQAKLVAYLEKHGFSKKE